MLRNKLHASLRAQGKAFEPIEALARDPRDAAPMQGAAHQRRPRISAASRSADPSRRRSHRTLDASDRILESLHAAGEREAHVSRGSEARSGHHGDARLDEQVFGEGVVVLDAECAHGTRDIRERIKGTGGVRTFDSGYGVQSRHHEIMTLLERLVHFRDARSGRH